MVHIMSLIAPARAAAASSTDSDCRRLLAAFGWGPRHAGPGLGGLGLVVAAQAGGQGVGEGDHQPQDARPVGRQGLARQQGDHLARQAAALEHQPPPLPARLPPAVVAGAVAEAQEDRQRQADQGERRQALAPEILRAPFAQQGHRHGQQGDGRHLWRDLRHDGAAHGEQDVEQAGAGV
ncbi:MAG: hypothetical protein WDM92_16375 [Caulobacteraceae bacterium]